MRRENIEVAGRRVEHLRLEREGPPLVLLHGAGANAEVWRPVCAKTHGFDLAAPSLPGRGESEGAPPATAAEAADGLERYLDALDVEAPILLGHSYGGAVAIELALRGRAQGLVLVATGARRPTPRPPPPRSRRGGPGGAPMSAALAFGSGVDSSTVAAYGDAASRTPPAAALADWRACDAFDRMDALSEVRAPALVIAGEDDALTPPKFHAFLAEHLPRAQLERIAGAGHMLPWSHTERLARMLRTWAAGVT